MNNTRQSSLGGIICLPWFPGAFPGASADHPTPSAPPAPAPGRVLPQLPVASTPSPSPQPGAPRGVICKNLHIQCCCKDFALGAVSGSQQNCREGPELVRVPAPRAQPAHVPASCRDVSPARPSPTPAALDPCPVPTALPFPRVPGTWSHTAWSLSYLAFSPEFLCVLIIKRLFAHCKDVSVCREVLIPTGKHRLLT